MLRLATGASLALLVFTTVDGWAQEAPGVRPVPLRAGIQPGTDPLNATSGAVGVIPRGEAEPPPFDPKSIATPTPGAPLAGEATGDVIDSPVEDMITFKSNFEKEIKCRKLPLNAKINIDFEDAPLDDLIKFIGCITEKNFLSTGAAKGKQITIMSPNPVTVYEAYRAFLASLEINGLTLVPSGQFLKIEDVGKAKTDTLPIYGSGQSVPNEERFVIRFVQLEHVSADDMLPIVQKFKTANGDAWSYPPTNSLVITDTGANIRRIIALLAELDVPTGKERVWLRQIEYAEAQEIATKLQDVFGDQGKASPAGAAAQAARRSTRNPRAAQAPAAVAPTTEPTTVGEDSEGKVTISKILADERTNQLIIVANRTSYFKVDKLIRKLDVPIPGEGQIHIHYLENADAEEISSTLSNLTQGGGGSGARRPAARTGAAGAAGGAAAGAAAGGATGAALFEGEVKISAHQETNSLVIESSLKDYLALKQVIQKLDIRRKQVYIEAVIMEITSSKDTNLGINGSTGAVIPVGGDEVPLIMGLGGVGISGLNTSQLNSGGLAVGLQGPLVDVDPGSLSDIGVGALSIPTFGFLIQALQRNSDVNFLSTPHILTTDNEEAEIQVGKQVPYQAASFGGLGGLSSLAGLGGGLGGAAGNRSGTSTTGGLGGLAGGLGGLGGLGLGGLGLGGIGQIQFVDVDLTLKITPHINESDFVRLEIDQELEDLENLDPVLGPTTSRRHVTNTVVVKDQQPVVIGGLIRDIENEGINKIPFLGDIPVLGHLFRKKVRKTEKKNLLMIIIPTIIEDPSDLKRIHENRITEMRELADALATKKKEYLGHVDYRKKSGVLEQMFKVVDTVRTDRELLEKSQLDQSELDVIGPPETHDIEYDPFEEPQKERGDEENE